jgi:hypothetical protein
LISAISGISPKILLREGFERTSQAPSNKLTNSARFLVPIRVLAFYMVLGVIWLVVYFSLSRFWEGVSFALPVRMVLLYEDMQTILQQAKNAIQYLLKHN